MTQTETFPQTHWSVVLAAGVGGHHRAEEALAELCSSYWYPLFAFARRRGFSPDDAKDLTQGFFSLLTTSGMVAKADPQKGRFRSFLLACFTHYISSETDRAQALKRGGGRLPPPLDLETAERRLAHELHSQESPERMFDRHWALAVLGTALEQLRVEFAAEGRTALFDELQPFLQGDACGPTYAEIAQRLNTTAGTIGVTVHRLRKRYRQLLCSVVSRTVNSPLDVDAELTELMAALRP